MMLRPVTIRHYLAVMHDRGFSDSQVLMGSGVEADRLGETAYFIELEQYQKVVRNMLRLSGETGLGFEVGLRTELTDLGIVGYAMMSCKTMRDALGLWLQYGNALVGVMSKLRLTSETSEALTLRFVEPPPQSDLYIFCVEELLAIIQKVGTLLAGEPPQITNLFLSYKAPAHAQRYHELFACPIRFGLAHSGYTVSRPWVGQPLRTKDEEHNSVCLHHCGQILRQIEAHNPITSRLRDLFLRQPAALPSLDEAAKALSVSARTLRRHLHGMETSYQQLIDEFRADLAREYLKSTTLSPKEIAYLLGFSDHSTFRRAFKSWTGTSIQDFRSAD